MLRILLCCMLYGAFALRSGSLQQLESECEPQSAGDSLQMLKAELASFENSWFVAKERLVYSIDMAQGEYNKVLNREEQSNILRMQQLVCLRGIFVCSFIAGAWDPHRLDAETRTRKYRADCYRSGPVSLGGSFQGCFADSGKGSTTILSDLDFSARCLASEGQGDIERMEREWAAARHLYDHAYELLGTPPGTALDVNFYFNAFAYNYKSDLLTAAGLSLGAPCENFRDVGVALGFYALAKGILALKTAAAPSGCAALAETLKSLSIGPVWQFLMKTYQEVRACSQCMKKINEAMARLIIEDKRLHDEHDRVERYFEMDREAIATKKSEMYDVSDDGAHFARASSDPWDFCWKSGAAFIFANQAYWTEGSIALVFGSASLSSRQALEAILMNMGYALTHMAEALHDALERFVEANVMRSRIGDGLIKFGKYTHRARKAYRIARARETLGATEALDQGEVFAMLKKRAKVDKRPHAMDIANKEAYHRVVASASGVCGLLHSSLRAAVSISQDTALMALGDPDAGD
eukprot:TRINITY_DN40874_c0_g1_i1.p1 TRINITY_DN40874_c0_g1~~TRINITY_DN40874_c0_g1_i1.p1  ORF type:complete len:525 (+),score=93.42 TRINITY_DN40874_c0_g1_i1:113-1687(+)